MRAPGEVGGSSHSDRFVYDRLIRNLVEQGFGTWRECAAADIIDAAIFVYVGSDAVRRAEEWMKS